MVSKELSRALRNERDMLDGNLNRMSVCDDTDELFKQFMFSIRRTLNLFDLNVQRFREKELCSKHEEK